VPLVVCGGYWYARNTLIVGNPVPAVHLPGLPSPSVPLVEGPRGRSVADYLLDAEVWREVFVPGTAHAFGALWPVLLGAIIVAIGMGLRRSADRVVRLLAGVVAVATLGCLITPTTAFSDGDRVLAHFFEANLRYAFPAIALATLLVCATAAARRWQVPALVVVGVAVVVSVASSSTFDIWPEWELAWAAVLATGIAALATWMVMDRRPAWIRQPAVNAMLALGCIGVFLAGFVLQRHHYTNRYSSDLWPASPALIGMRNVEDAEIAVGGGFFHIYPLVGADLSNHVDRVGISQPHHGLTRPSSCRAWRHALQARRYDFVVLAPSFEPEADPPERGWTRSDRSAVRVTIDEDRASAFQLVGRPDPTTCEEAETS
jgi:hypothetical protein